VALATMVATPNAAAADKSAATSTTMTKTGTKYRADADMQAVLDELASLGGKPIETLMPQEARKQPTPADAVMSLLKKQGKDTSPTALVPGVTSTDREIPGAAGRLAARVYTPAGPGPFPVVVYFHGGGWVIADKQVYDGGARGLSKTAQAIVVSVDYRRAPEDKFPAAWDDALAAYKWVVSNAKSLNGDPARLALAGESAGGNLALATAVAARDAGLRAPTHVLAVYPVAQTGDLDNASYRDSATAKPLNKAMIEWFVDKLLAAPGSGACQARRAATGDNHQRANRSASRGRRTSGGGPQEGWRQSAAHGLPWHDARVLRHGGSGEKGRGCAAGGWASVARLFRGGIAGEPLTPALKPGSRFSAALR